jgi:hypothetical protein
MGHHRRRRSTGAGVSNRKLSDLLPQVVAEIGKISQQEAHAVFALWRTLLGEKMAPLTEPLSFVKGVLIVKVKSATLFGLLSVHEKPRLLQQLQSQFRVRDILFRVG